MTGCTNALQCRPARLAGLDEVVTWHVIIEGEQRGPLSRTEILEYLRDGRLTGNDLIWRPGFSDWKSVSELAEFWQPPERDSLLSQSDVVATPQAATSDRKWSVWKAANFGLLVSALLLAIQIASGRGFELASYAKTASAETIAALAGQILAPSVLFVLVALVRNAFKSQLPKSDTRVIDGVTGFVLLLIGIGLSLAFYGYWFFGSIELISGATRDHFVKESQLVCVRRQLSLKQGANPSDDQIARYCWCVSEQLADNTTYKRLTSDTSAPDVRDYLKQQAEAAGQTCRARVGL